MSQLPGKAEANPREYVNSIQLCNGNQVRSSDLIDENAKQGGEVDLSVEKKADKPKKSVKTSPYRDKLSFPGRLKIQLLNKFKAKFEKQMNEVQIPMPMNVKHALGTLFKTHVEIESRKRKRQEQLVGITVDELVLMGFERGQGIASNEAGLSGYRETICNEIDGEAKMKEETTKEEITKRGSTSGEFYYWEERDSEIENEITADIAMVDALSA
ncbi:unnamed protein product [Cochlearia groenlandica]